MADQDQKLCDICHERPGTNHICYGHGGEGRSVCEICLKQDPEIGGFMERFAEAVRTGQCKYCGAPAELSYGASTSFVAGDHFNLVCKVCFEDLTEFARRPENAMPDFEPEDKVAFQKVVAQFKDRQKREDEFIKQRVLERKSN